MSKELRLSKIINSLVDGDISEGGSSSGGSGFSRAIQVGPVTWGNVPSVRAETVNGVTTLYFTLVHPIENAEQFMATVSETDHHHIIDAISLTTTEITELNLTQTPNSCPIIVMVKGQTFAEVNQDFFTVDREHKKITWNPTSTGIILTTITAAPKVYIHYETSKTIGHRRANFDISDITTNTIKLTETPNDTKAMIIINGVCYFEDKGDFSLNRGTQTIQWSSQNTGFSISSSTLSGYITVCYDVDLS